MNIDHSSHSASATTLRTIILATVTVAFALVTLMAHAQDEPKADSKAPAPEKSAPKSKETPADKPDKEKGTPKEGVKTSEEKPAEEKTLEEKAEEAATAAKEKVQEAATATRKTIDQVAESDEAKRAAGAVVDWLKAVETIYLPWINWVLVAVGIALFISHAGQLLFGKLIVLFKRGSLDLTECFNDLLVTVFSGLALPAVLTIPAGHGSFISNPLAVLTAAAVGMLTGVFLYSHGTAQEAAAAARRKEESKEKSD